MLSNMTIFIIIMTAVLCVLAVLVYREIKRELNSFQVVHYNISSKKIKETEKKLVFLSDLHNHVYGEDNETLVNAIIDENPDYILIGGDMIVSGSRKSYMPALRFVKNLLSLAPVYYANGNHEQRVKEWVEDYHISYAAYHRALEDEGVHFLENDSLVLDMNETKVRLTGLEIPLTCYKHFRKVKLNDEEIVERICESRKDCYEVLLAHNPSYAKQYAKWGADLVLSGHLHGGIVRIPKWRGVVSPSLEIFPKYSGDHYRIEDTSVVVSKGLGTHTFNIRLFNPAEVIVLHLKSE